MEPRSRSVVAVGPQPAGHLSILHNRSLPTRSWYLRAVAYVRFARNLRLGGDWPSITLSCLGMTGVDEIAMRAKGKLDIVLSHSAFAVPPEPEL